MKERNSIRCVTYWKHPKDPTLSCPTSTQMVDLRLADVRHKRWYRRVASRRPHRFAPMQNELEPPEQPKPLSSGYYTGLYHPVSSELLLWHIMIHHGNHSEPLSTYHFNDYTYYDWLCDWPRFHHVSPPKQQRRKRTNCKLGLMNLNDSMMRFHLKNLIFRKNNEDQLVDSGLLKPMIGSRSRDETARTCIL